MLGIYLKSLFKKVNLCKNTNSCTSKLMYTEAMKKENSHHINTIPGEHFRFYLLLLRYVGVSLISRDNSKIYTLYSALPVLCAYSLFVAMILDTLKHKYNLQHISENVQACAGILCTFWIHQCFR
jgi:hypothetical protein